MTTTTTTTTTTTLPKNRTGIFAGDTLQDLKSIRNQTQFPLNRFTGSANVTVVSAEQNRMFRRGMQLDRKNPLIINGIRNGFRPSTVRCQKARILTTMKHRDTKDSIVLKESFSPSAGSARLKAEIEQLNSRLKSQGDINKFLQYQTIRDASTTPQSALSYSTINRLSSASTNHTTNRIHQRFSSALTSLLSTPTLTKETSSKTLVAPSSPSNEDENQSNDFNQSITHAYQIPQQSNVGCQSIFPSHSPTLPVRRTLIPKPISCPFYVMYFTNLTLQSNEQKRIPSSSSTTKKTFNQSRIPTSSARLHSSKRQVHSPISLTTCSTLADENDSTSTLTPYYNQKRFSARMTAFENENTLLLKDILRTTSWNHLQI